MYGTVVEKTREGERNGIMMKRVRGWAALAASLIMCVMMTMSVFAEEQEIVFVSEEIIVEEEGIVEAGQHGTVMVDPSLGIGTAVFSNNTIIQLKVNCRTFGTSMDDYRIEIYRGDTAVAGGYTLVAKGVKDFKQTVASYNDIFEVDTKDTSVFTPGTYTIVCTSYYYSENGTQMINQSDRATFTIEDYHLVLDREFVKRLYLTALERGVDPVGLKDWSEKLYYGKMTGAQVVENIFESEEFVNKKKTDEEYVELLYRAVFNRESDAPGREQWLNFLKTGFSRKKVLKGFVDSGEFANLCATYEVNKGTVELKEYRDQNEGVTGFVSRLYYLALLREPDAKGLNEWTERLLKKQKTPKEVAFGFVFSSEMNERNLDNTAFVTMLYQTILGREPDGPGLADWVGQLDKKTKTRESIYSGFADSKEFAEIVASYNIK